MLQINHILAYSRNKRFTAFIIVMILLLTAMVFPLQQVDIEPKQPHSMIMNEDIQLTDLIHIRTHAPSGCKVFFKLLMIVIVYILLLSTLWKIPYRYIFTTITSSLRRLLLMPIKQTTTTYTRMLMGLLNRK